MNLLVDFLYAAVDPRTASPEATSGRCARLGELPPAPAPGRSAPWLTFKALFGAGILACWRCARSFRALVAPYDPTPPGPDGGADAAAVFRRAVLLRGRTTSGASVLSRVIYGARVSLVDRASRSSSSPAVVGRRASASFSGYFGRTTDFVIQKLVEVMWPSRRCCSPSRCWPFLGQGLGILIMALTLQRWSPLLPRRPRQTR